MPLEVYFASQRCLAWCAADGYMAGHTDHMLLKSNCSDVVWLLEKMEACFSNSTLGRPLSFSWRCSHFCCSVFVVTVSMDSEEVFSMCCKRVIEVGSTRRLKRAITSSSRRSSAFMFSNTCTSTFLVMTPMVRETRMQPKVSVEELT